MSNNFDLRKFLSENKLTATAKVLTKEEFNTEAPVSEMNGGYIEVMGPDFDEATDLLSHAWNQWKNGPATEEEDIELAKADILQYIKAVILK